MARPFNLTGRELDVARLLAVGSTNKEISQALSIGLQATKSHVTAVLRKLGADNRTRAALRLRGRLDP